MLPQQQGTGRRVTQGPARRRMVPPRLPAHRRTEAPSISQLCSGGQDAIFPPATQYLAAAAVPNSWVITVPDAGHVSCNAPLWPLPAWHRCRLLLPATASAPCSAPRISADPCRRVPRPASRCRRCPLRTPPSLPSRWPRSWTPPRWAAAPVALGLQHPLACGCPRGNATRHRRRPHHPCHALCSRLPCPFTGAGLGCLCPLLCLPRQPPSPPAAPQQLRCRRCRLCRPGRGRRRRRGAGPGVSKSPAAAAPLATHPIANSTVHPSQPPQRRASPVCPTHARRC